MDLSPDTPRPDLSASSADATALGRDLTRAAVTLAIAGGAVAVALFVGWSIREALMLVFASVVVAVLLLAAATPLERWCGLSRSWSLPLVGLLFLLLGVGAGWLMGAQVRGQVTDLVAQLPQAARALQQRFGISLDDAGSGLDMQSIGGMVRSVAGSLFTVGTTVVSAVSSLVLVIVGGFFLAASPALYRSGIVMLFPRRHQARLDPALCTAGRALRLWVLAQLIAMVMVGALAGIGTWLLGLPAPLALGLFAGLMEFIPLIGSIGGAVPAVLLALSQGPMMALWTVLLFVVIQQVESNLIMPVVQRQMVELPPALLLFSVVAVGLLFGLLGVLIAAPLTVVIYVLVKVLWVRDALGQQTSVPGEG
ncbi:MAG: AI-2E family transporter [Rhodospirillales bacterium]|nr:AI-2E family transporter [Rhodospirillales bacterium]MBN8897441.1 AI-2E family transporter [Rhodospirillales bacterium]